MHTSLELLRSLTTFVCAGTLLCAPLAGQHVLHTFIGDLPGDNFSGRITSISGIGDVNQDGHADLAVGSSGADVNGINSGSTRIFSGKDGSILHDFHGQSAGDRFGFSVNDAGDVNNDGFPDMIVGARRNGQNGMDAGSAWIFSGEWIAAHTSGGTPLTPQVLHVFYGDQPGDLLGHVVSGLGDVDQDGFDDVLVGAPQLATMPIENGYARVYSGQSGNILATFSGESAGDSFGYCAAGPGDITADGIPDILIGADRDSVSGPESGSAWVYSGATMTLLHRFGGVAAGDRMGYALSFAGDVNNDGYRDLLVGSIFHESTGPRAGSAHVFSGEWVTSTANGQTPATNEILYVWYGGPIDQLGSSVSGVGDVNNDGFDDVFVGAHHEDLHGFDSGTGYLYSGRNGAVLYSFHGNSDREQHARAVSEAGDVNGDGIPDLLAGGADENDSMAIGLVRVYSGWTFTLGEPQPGLAGQINTLSLSGATPGGIVALAFSFEEGLTKIAQCLYQSFDMVNATPIAVNIAGPLGNAVFTDRIPSSLSGKTIRLQALDLGACVVSNLVTFEVP